MAQASLVNPVIDPATHRVFQEFGGVPFNAVDQSYARAIQVTLRPSPGRALSSGGDGAA